MVVAATPQFSTPPAAEGALVLQDVTRRFGDRVAVDDVDLAVAEGEVFALLGPSGSGKSTLLRLVAGFETPDEGRIEIAGLAVAGDGRWIEPERRGIGLVPQGETLFPHLTVGENVEFGIRGNRERARQTLELVGLADRYDSRTHELSGGERQRVALARALAPNPALVLLDEPFSALDAALRRRLRRDVVDILRAAGSTAVLVTHDQEEALALADRVAVLHDGRITQCATPSELYWTPRDRWTARFVGEVNIVPGDISNGSATTALGEIAIATDESLSGRRNLAFRPEQLVIHRATGGDATVIAREFRGHHSVVEVHHPNLGGLLVRTSSQHPIEPGDQVHVAADTNAVAAVLVD